VFDVEKGLVLKLGEHKEVLAALHGRKNLTADEIKAIYGSPVPKFERIEFPKVTSFNEEDGKHFWTFSTYFDMCKVPQVLMGVEMILQGKVNKTYNELATAMRRTVYRQYVHMQDGVVHPADTYG